MSLRFAPVILRYLAVLGLMLAWLVCTNHCGLLLWTGEQMGQAQCCGDPVESDEAPLPGGHGAGCCKSIHAPLAEKVTVPLAPDLLLPEATVGAPPLVPPARSSICQVEPARGPPRAPTVLERVLGSAQISHAPPAGA